MPILSLRNVFDNRLRVLFLPSLKALRNSRLLCLKSHCALPLKVFHYIIYRDRRY